jgi:methionine-rich copper-binding protein CopC
MTRVAHSTMTRVAHSTMTRAAYARKIRAAYAGMTREAYARMIPAVALVLAAVLGAPPAMAHAFLERARPPVGSQVATPPQTVALSFTEDIEPRFSRIEVFDPQGGRVDTGDTRAEGGGKILVVGVKPLAPGRYAVVWHVTSVDTHKTEGRFEFTVGP